MLRNPVQSSNLKSVGYYELCGVLEVEFNTGAVYRYHGVPEHIYREFMTAKSVGKYFAQNIKNNFRTAKFPGEAIQVCMAYRQLDTDGVEVGVSRQALEEVLEWMRYG